jgi:hypothetical protein
MQLLAILAGYFRELGARGLANTFKQSRWCCGAHGVGAGDARILECCTTFVRDKENYGGEKR